MNLPTHFEVAKTCIPYSARTLPAKVTWIRPFFNKLRKCLLNGQVSAWTVDISSKEVPTTFSWPRHTCSWHGSDLMWLGWDTAIVLQGEWSIVEKSVYTRYQNCIVFFHFLRMLFHDSWWQYFTKIHDTPKRLKGPNVNPCMNATLQQLSMP